MIIAVKNKKIENFLIFFMPGGCKEALSWYTYIGSGDIHWDVKLTCD